MRKYKTKCVKWILSSSVIFLPNGGKCLSELGVELRGVGVWGEGGWGATMSFSVGAERVLSPAPALRHPFVALSSYSNHYKQTMCDICGKSQRRGNKYFLNGLQPKGHTY